MREYLLFFLIPSELIFEQLIFPLFSFQYMSFSSLHSVFGQLFRFEEQCFFLFGGDSHEFESVHDEIFFDEII